MARSKWIFGNQQNQPARDTARPAPLPTESSSADSRQIGLENFGNTCYANSVIQALYFCAPFRDLLLQSPDAAGPVAEPEQHLNLVPVRRTPERKASTSGTINDGASSSRNAIPIPPNPSSLFSALRSLFLHISTHPSDKGTVAPSAFIEQLRRANEIFRTPMHQDAHEFFNYLLNKIVEEIEEDRKAIQNKSESSEDLSNSIASMASRPAPTTNSAASGGTLDSTLVHKLFEGTLTSETRCLTCETVSSRDESFIDLSIDIEENSSVTACLRQFSASEMLCQKNKFFCDSCCDLQEAEKRMKIKKLPNVLALHLKRFKYQEDLNKYIKLAYRVAFPLQLRLFNTVDDAEDADRLYNLFAIVIHLGTGPHHGHYISIIKALGTWLVFDDDNVYPITEKEIPKYYGDSNSGSAYVLYYEAADMDLPTLGLRTTSPPTASAASVHQSEATPSTPSQMNPLLPPGLADEGDSSDLSDPAFPITPAQNSPLLSPVVEKNRPALEVNVPDFIGAPSPSPASPAPSSPALNGRGSRGLFKRASARPNTAGGPESHRSAVEAFTPPSQPNDDFATAKLRPNRTPSPVPPPSYASHTSSDKREGDKKSTGWFGKRKSLRISGKKEQDPEVSSPRHKADDTATNHTASTSSSNASSTWYKVNSHAKDARDRRPSEPSPYNANSVASPRSARPKSTAENLTLKPQTWSSHGQDTPPGSATSSTGSGSGSTTFTSPAPPHVLQTLPARNSSLSPDLPPKSPDRKKSLTSLPRMREKHRKPVIDTPPRPSTAPSAPVESTSSSAPPPPVPPIPPLLTPNGSVDGFFPVEKGKMKEDSSSPLHPSPISAGVHTPAPGLGSFAGANTSASSTGSATSNLKRASRKLSISGQMFGFGRKDRERKEREREREEREGGKGPPSSHAHH